MTTQPHQPQITPYQSLQTLQKQDLLSSLTSNQPLQPQPQPQQPQPQAQPSRPTAKTSLKAATFAMMAGALGPGIFNLPYRITQTGIVMFVVYVLIAGLFSYMGCWLLRELIVAKGFDGYGHLCQAAFGAPFKRLLQLCIVLFPWGIAVCFQVIMPRFIIQLLVDIFSLNLYQNKQKQLLNPTGSFIRVILNLAIICTNFLLIQLKDIRVIQQLSVIGVCSVIFNAVTIFVTLLVGFRTEGEFGVQYKGILGLDWSVMELVVFQGNGFSVHLQALATILFCYINHQLVFPTCKNLQNPTTPRLTTCFLLSNLTEFALYNIIGLSGYILLMQNQNILPIGPMVLTSITIWPMKIGKALMVVTLFLAVPLNLFPARTVLFQALGLERNNRNHYVLSFGLAVSSCAVAITFVKVNSYFGLLGGTAGVLIGGGIPAICYWKLILKQSPQKSLLKNYLILIFAAVITILAMTGAILSVVDPA